MNMQTQKQGGCRRDYTLLREYYYQYEDSLPVR